MFRYRVSTLNLIGEAAHATALAEQPCCRVATNSKGPLTQLGSAANCSGWRRCISIDLREQPLARLSFKIRSLNHRVSLELTLSCMQPTCGYDIAYSLVLKYALQCCGPLGVRKVVICGVDEPCRCVVGQNLQTLDCCSSAACGEPDMLICAHDLVPWFLSNSCLYAFSARSCASRRLTTTAPAVLHHPKTLKHRTSP